MPKNTILLHQHELKATGVEVKLMGNFKKMVQIPHRDDHYMFIIQQDGQFLWELDFNEVKLLGPTLCFIVPGQVHRYIEGTQGGGWLVFVDSEVIPALFREIFGTYLNVCQSVSIKSNDPVFNLMPLLEDTLSQPSIPLQKTLIKSLTEALTGAIASKLMQVQNTTNLLSGQKYTIVKRFKQLVNTKCKELKLVKGYASLLNISPLYLNEVVKEITGFAASHWIQHEILLEAKRLLCYSPLDIKQIAYELGYEDHAYFSRFFKKNTGLTASVFRAKNH